MSYRLGVDVGGTFTDVLLVDEDSGSTWRAKTASTPADQAVGVLNGIGQVCADGRHRPGRGRPRCCTAPRSRPTRSSRARAPRSAWSRRRASGRSCRSPARYVPGGLAGWIIWPKPEPLAELENTVEVDERIASDGAVIRPLDDADVRAPAGEARRPRHPGADRLADQRLRRPGAREADRRARRRAAARRPGVAVLGRAARDARVRAHPDHGRQRLRAAAGAALRAQPVATSSREGGVAGRAVDPAQRRRPAVGRRRGRRTR